MEKTPTQPPRVNEICQELNFIFSKYPDNYTMEDDDNYERLIKELRQLIEEGTQ
tara:strand:+ start:1019 stop:1180 length:162 start_codon:yes stop_codon:yes gene_type:complete